jgi:hypothetical protein
LRRPTRSCSSTLYRSRFRDGKPLLHLEVLHV